MGRPNACFLLINKTEIDDSNVEFCADYEYHNLKNIKNGLGGPKGPQSKKNTILRYVYFFLFVISNFEI